MEISGRARALLTLLWILQGDSQRVEIPRKEMEVVEGQMVVLEAWYSPSSDISRNSIIWNFMANESKLVISYSNGEQGIGNPEFRQRAGFSKSMPSANLSIYINNTQESDSGRYLCNVLIHGAPGLSGELRLNVKVPPSPPVCTISGSSVLNGNVTLSCKSSSGKPAPLYKWTKTAPMSEFFFSPMQNERQGTLRLSNLNKNMSGKYVCRASNTAGSDTCSINLEVITSTNSGAFVAATLGSIVGLVAIILFLIIILRKSRNHEEDEVANDIKEDAQAPKRVSLAKSGTGSDIISKNGTLSSITTSPHPQDHHQLNNYQYPYPLASDAGSVLHAYRLRPGEPSALQGLPGYNISSTPPSGHARRLSSPHGNSRPHTSNHVSGTLSSGHSRPPSVIVDTPLHGVSQPQPSSSHVDVTTPQEHSGPARSDNIDAPISGSYSRPLSSNNIDAPISGSYSRPLSSNHIGAPISRSYSRPLSSNNIRATPPYMHGRPHSLNHIGGISPHSQSRPPSSNRTRNPSIGNMAYYGRGRSPGLNCAPPHFPPGQTVMDPHKTEGAQPQVPRPLTSPISSATLNRIGAVPVMLPAQSHAGSLV
ncbi:hypothetical protein DPEC_G00245350 [Dallia pectoralis]|uniref:Uncharacterized protein n=1 Tax=Dallia pectoralis TaxID=75939 RepID=A0ACC2FVZ1_DALPE|nr:hypothetical protein DPEC_G00245350 [Dallia pectoralis]